MRGHHEQLIAQAIAQTLTTGQTLGVLALPALVVGRKAAQAIRAALERMKGGAL